jgi:hypothetical protein
MNPQVVIVVLGADGKYAELIKTIRETWGKAGLCEVLYCYGYRAAGPRPEFNEVLEIDDNLLCGCSENLDNIGIKNVLSLEHILNTRNPDYVFRCCCGSYIHQKGLLSFIMDKPKEKFYCGVKAHTQGTDFASGSGYFLSKDLIRFAVDHKEELMAAKEIDDVALGRFMSKYGFQVYPGARRIDIDGDDQLSRLDNVDLSSEYHYHFRHRTGVMREIHKRITSLP